MEQTECSETSVYKIQTPGNYPEESIQRTEHGESLKSRIHVMWFLHLRNNRTSAHWWHILSASIRLLFLLDSPRCKYPSVHGHGTYIVNVMSDLTQTGTHSSLHFFYSKTNQMHNIPNLFYFETTLYMFRTVFPSLIRSLRLYIYLMLYYTLRLLIIDGKTVRNMYSVVPK